MLEKPFEMFTLSQNVISTFVYWFILMYCFELFMVSIQTVHKWPVWPIGLYII